MNIFTQEFLSFCLGRKKLEISNFLLPQAFRRFLKLKQLQHFEQLQQLQQKA